VVIKDGANGAWIGCEGETCHVPAVDAGPVVDTTGAGDCFNAGFLFGHVVEKAPPEICARYGNICGGLSVTQVGGSTASPTREQLMYWLEHY
jgi:sugar/nucleoside kinase (ribokinase family)